MSLETLPYKAVCAHTHYRQLAAYNQQSSASSRKWAKFCLWFWGPPTVSQKTRCCVLADLPEPFRLHLREATSWSAVRSKAQAARSAHTHPPTLVDIHPCLYPLLMDSINWRFWRRRKRKGGGEGGGVRRRRGEEEEEEKEEKKNSKLIKIDCRC